MDELTLLHDLHSDTPGPSAAETATARARLIDAMADPRSGAVRATSSGRRMAVWGWLARRRLWAPVAAAGAVTAVAITAAAIAVPGSGAAQPAGPGTGSPTAASVLSQAAAAAADQPPGHGRYFAVENEYLTIHNSRATAVRIQWIGDGVGGRQVGPGGFSVTGIPDGIAFGDRRLTWAQFQRLPTDPGQLQAAIARASRVGGEPPVASEFSLIANLLAKAPGSPALRSSLYQVAARLPGLALILHARDQIGRAATEVYVPPGQVVVPAGQAMYFNPSTSAVLDVAMPGQPPRCPDTWEEAVLASGYVGTAYQLPAAAVPSARPVPLPSAFPACGVQPAVPPSPVTSSPVPTPSPTAPPTPVPSPTAPPTPSPSV